MPEKMTRQHFCILSSYLLSNYIFGTYFTIRFRTNPFLCCLLQFLDGSHGTNFVVNFFTQSNPQKLLVSIISYHNYHKYKMIGFEGLKNFSIIRLASLHNTALKLSMYLIRCNHQESLQLSISLINQSKKAPKFFWTTRKQYIYSNIKSME